MKTSLKFSLLFLLALGSQACVIRASTAPPSKIIYVEKPVLVVKSRPVPQRVVYAPAIVIPTHACVYVANGLEFSSYMSAKRYLDQRHHEHRVRHISRHCS